MFLDSIKQWLNDNVYPRPCPACVPMTATSLTLWFLQRWVRAGLAARLTLHPATVTQATCGRQ